MRKMTFLFVVLAIAGCTSKATSNETQVTDTIVAADEQPVEQKEFSPATVGDIPLPNGFERMPITDTTSFAYFLRNLPLKPLGTPVYTYYGDIASTTHSAYAVIDGFAPGNEDLQQCADAVIRLRAEWLYKNKRYDEIAFHFTNGWLCEYKRWAEGERVHVQGNKTSWYKAFYTPDYSYDTFLQYLKIVFNYAGTISLSKELKKAHIRDLQIGDVFVKGGSPGHAIIVVDVANCNYYQGEKCFLVAESYMPAQDIHIIINTNNYREETSPWHLMFDVYRSGPDYDFTTYIFGFEDLKRF